MIGVKKPIGFSSITAKKHKLFCAKRIYSSLASLIADHSGKSSKMFRENSTL